MAAGAPTLFIPAKKKLLNGGFNLSADALKACVVQAAQGFNPGWLGASGDARYADLTQEFTSAQTGYTAGGQAIAGVALSYFVASAAIAAPGTGGTTGAQTVTGTTGAGVKAQVPVTVSGGAITAIAGVPSVGGAYTTLPTNPGAEPVTGGGLTGAQLQLTMGVALAFTSPTWNPISTVGSTGAKYLVVYDNTQANKDLLFWADFEVLLANGLQFGPGGVLTWNPNAAGVLQLN